MPDRGYGKLARQRFPRFEGLEVEFDEGGFDHRFDGVGPDFFLNVRHETRKRAQHDDVHDLDVADFLRGRDGIQQVQSGGVLADRGFDVFGILHRAQHHGDGIDAGRGHDGEAVLAEVRQAAERFEFLEREKNVPFALRDDGRIDLVPVADEADDGTAALAHPVYLVFLHVVARIEKGFADDLGSENNALAADAADDDAFYVHECLLSSV